MTTTGEGEMETGPGLRRHGVVVAPPQEAGGGWLVSVCAWDDRLGSYVSRGEGPILDSEGEAMEESARALHWIASLPSDVDPIQAWERLQRTRAAAERDDDRPRPWGRF